MKPSTVWPEDGQTDRLTGTGSLYVRAQKLISFKVMQGKYTDIKCLEMKGNIEGHSYSVISYYMLSEDMVLHMLLTGVIFV